MHIVPYSAYSALYIEAYSDSFHNGVWLERGYKNFPHITALYGTEKLRNLYETKASLASLEIGIEILSVLCVNPVHL